MIAAAPLVQEPAPTIVGERVNSQGSRKAKELLLADDYDGLLQVAEDQVEGGAHVLDLCVALTERQDEDEQMRRVAKKVSLTQPSPIQVDSTEPDVIATALDQIPGRAIVNSVNLEAGEDKLNTRRPDRDGARRRADRADDRRGRHGQDPRAQARGRQADRRPRLQPARDGPRAADLRRADVHAHDRRRGVAAVRGRDDRGHPADQVRAARREDLARRLERLLRHRPARAQRPELRLPRALRGGRAGPRDGQPEPHHALRRDPASRARARRRPRLQPPRGRARALHPALRGQGPGGRGRGRRPDRRHGARGGAALAHPAAQARGRGGADRRLRREDRRRPDAQHRAAAGHEGGRRQVRRRRADPALRAPERRGHEARRRPARAVPRQARGLHQGHRRARDRLRRRARHRQVAGQHDPHQQRLHGRRPRQAGADLDDPRRGQGAQGDRDRALRPARLHLQADAAGRPGAAPAGARVPGAARRRRDQPQVRAARAVRRGQGVRRPVRPRRLLLQGRVRGPGRDGPSDRARPAR